MSTPRDDLLKELRHNRVLVVVGAGVSIGASGGNPLAGWPGLLLSGVEHCEQFVGGDIEGWAADRRAEIDSKRVAKLIEAAGHISSMLRKKGEYASWLHGSVGSLELVDRTVIDAIARLDVPIVTTNYDNLIEKATGLDAVTWSDQDLFLEVAQGGEEKGVLHLHGHYRQHMSVVLGTEDYDGITRNRPTQAVQQAVSTLKTLVLVGYGGGLDDPNFQAFRTWMREAFGSSRHRHYRLCVQDELIELQRQHQDEPIVPVAYGDSHHDLATFLNALADDLRRERGKPPRRRWLRRPRPRRRPPRRPGAVRGWLGRPVGGPRRSVPLWAVLALVAVLVGGLLVTRAIRSGVGVAAPCPIPLELTVLTTPTKEASVRQLAVAFGDQAPGACRRSSVTVFSAPSSSAVAGALAAGWPPDDLPLGPQPAVWLPDATAEVERVNRQLSKKLEPLGSIATSPVVLAVPASAMAKVGGARTVPWRTMVGWARGGAPGTRLRIGRPDPTSSTAGLLATIGLHASASRSVSPDERRHAVEQTIDPVADELTELCQLGQAGGGAARAVLVPEQAMVAHNRGAQLGGSCAAGQPEAQARLTAVYAEDGTPVLDHPFVLLPAALELGDRERLARDFFAYVTSGPAQKQLREAGFRDLDRRVGGTVGEQDGVMVHDPPTWAGPPDGATLVRELAAWQRARLPARALLAMDVSGSMDEELPGPGGRRITAARQAAARAVDLMGDKDQIGLWRFSQSLDGPRDYQELVPLGPAGSRVGGERRSERVVSALGRLKATPRDTGLYDTIDAGIETLRAGGGADAVEALVVVTDGENDDRNGGVGLDAVIDRLHTGDEVLVFLLTFGPARCDAGELARLTRQRELVRCLDADRIGLERAFEQVAATLWGTERLASQGGG